MPDRESHKMSIWGWKDPRTGIRRQEYEGIRSVKGSRCRCMFQEMQRKRKARCPRMAYVERFVTVGGDLYEDAVA